MPESAIYVGHVRHRRREPAHEFRLPLYMAWLDLSELPEVLDPFLLWSARRPAAAWFRRSDHIGDPSEPLAESVRALVARRTGRRPEGPVRVLTNLRTLGWCFNPVSFYYCFAPEGGVQAVVAAVTSTPWGQRHEYVIEAPPACGRVVRAHADKVLHVSPFMGMDHRYAWSLTAPGETLSVHIAAERGGATAFDATLALRRRELEPAVMRKVLLRHPAMAARVSAGIYAQALRLALKGAPHHQPPARRAEALR